jgi:hypothetical protein
MLNIGAHIKYINCLTGLFFLFSVFVACDKPVDAPDDNGLDTTDIVNDRCPRLVRVIEHELAEDDLLDLVQQQTLKYFWDFAEPNSGMARYDCRCRKRIYQS